MTNQYYLSQVYSKVYLLKSDSKELQLRKNDLLKDYLMYTFVFYW